MAAEIQAERVFFVRQQLHLGPWRTIWQANNREAAFVSAAEQIRLSEIAIALRPVAVLERAIDAAEQLSASGMQRDALWNQAVARTGLDQRFQDLLVDDAQVELFTELMQRGNAAGPFADLDDGADGAVAETLDRREAEPHAFRHHRKVQLAFVDVGRQHRDAALARFADIDGQLRR